MLAAGAGVAALVAWLTAACFALRDDPVRAGAAALTLGLGVGISAVLSASGSYGQYGASVGAGAGAFLLVQMLLGTDDPGGRHLRAERGRRLRPARRRRFAGRAAALVRRWRCWRWCRWRRCYPCRKVGIWLQAIVASIYGGIVSAAACLLSWSVVQQRLGL